MKSAHGWARFFAGLCVMIFGTLAVVSRPDPSRWTGRSSSSVLPRLAATLPPQGVQLSISQPEDSSCMLRFVTQYTRCGHHTTRIQSASPAPNGDRLAVQYAGWSLTATGEGFTLSREIDQLCPEHILARLEGGALHLYRNETGGSSLENYKTLPDPLSGAQHESVRRELTEGVVFDSAESLEDYLESVSS